MQFLQEDTVKVKQEDDIAEVVINRPQVMNALNVDVLQGLVLACDRLERDEKLRVVIVTGEGEQAFAAGADIQSVNQLGPRAMADYIELGQRAMRKLETLRVPVLAAINGFALGGGLELALACDIILASPESRLGLPEVGLGVIPGFGGTQRLLQRCGVGTARRMIYSGDMLTAEEARSSGLVDILCESSELMAQARQLARTIASRAPLAVHQAKKVIRRFEEQDLLSGLREEVEAFLKLFETADREEGMGAFLQRRDPVFRGR